MKKSITSLLVGLVLGTIYTSQGLIWLSNFIIEKWAVILAVILFFGLFLWFIYINIDSITKRILNTTVPEYSELVDNLFIMLETLSDENRRDELLENARQFSKQIVVKYVEINSRRIILNFMIGFLVISLGLLNITLLNSQNEIMNNQAVADEVNYRVSKLESIQASLKRSGRRDRTANNMLHDYFNYYFEILEFKEKHDHMLIDYYIDLENMVIYDETISNVNLANLILEKLDAERIYFTNVDFSSTWLDKAVFKDCTFYNCTFDSIKFINVDFEFCDFESCSFRAVDYNPELRANFSGSTFKDMKYYNEGVSTLVRKGKGLFNMEQCDSLLKNLHFQLDSLEKNNLTNSFNYDSLSQVVEKIQFQKKNFAEN